MSKYHRVGSEAGDKAEIKRSSKVRYRINWKRFAVFILLVVLVLFAVRLVSDLMMGA